MTADFEQAKSLFLEGTQLFESGDYDRAEQAFLASLAILPGRASTLSNLGAVRLLLGKPQEALLSLDQAVAAEPDNLGAWTHRAAALGDLGRHTEALACDDRALALDAGCAPVWHHRGLMLQQLQRNDEALQAFGQLVRLLPDNGEAWLLHGEALLRLGRDEEALASLDRCVAIDPGAARAWSRRGAILKQLRRPAESAAAFERAIALGDDTEMNRYLLASVTGLEAPAIPPDGYVRSLFDGYADDFETHLVQVLRYQAHTVMIENLRRLADRRFVSALDLGCGTGLCAPLLRPIAGRLEGVDLSPRMVEKSRARDLYDRVAQAELVEHLESTAQRHDLVVATDVFIYIGDLEPVFGSVRRVIEPGGVFCFTVEQAREDREYTLQPSLTYAHSESYLRQLARRHGFEVIEIAQHPVREDQHQPIPGLYAYLRYGG